MRNRFMAPSLDLRESITLFRKADFNFRKQLLQFRVAVLSYESYKIGQGVSALCGVEERAHFCEKPIEYSSPMFDQVTN